MVQIQNYSKHVKSMHAVLAGSLLSLGSHRRGAALSVAQRNPPADDVSVISIGGGVSLAVHRHDLSFAGFTNRSHHWHVFRGDEEVLPNARRLPFRNSDLIGGLTNLPDIPLGRASAARATGVLASYNLDTAGEEETAALKRAAEHLPYIEHRDTMSFEVIRWNRTGAWDGPFTGVLRRTANIHSAEEALAIAGVLANPTLPQMLLAHST
ncbi:hypothetical protein E2562_033704 [Oryza meyeriana var. granulata]|uniref:rRNA N-glycosylase n=1 Tax=Oryza meyeriana var. granulata TaxID=110450 RepID=A0A6G1DRH4_9ORYZ|nr:hypothetical protein E2562_033704 [Oryza meyeriana var. granulata]